MVQYFGEAISFKPTNGFKAIHTSTLVMMVNPVLMSSHDHIIVANKLQNNHY